jgi:xanthine/CO dehydrogenase XdhC/CoxF family maturation factor
MKTWQETARVFDELARLRDAGRKAALATLVKVEGSAYRRPGAKLLIRDDGSMLGNVSGGCLENDLRERALRVIGSGRPEPVHYDTGSDESVLWGLGLGCNGKIELYLQPAPFELVSEVQQKLAGTEPFDMTAGDFVEHLEPPPDLVVIGAGDDAIPLVSLAADAGFRVWLVDHRSAYLRAELFAGAHRMICARPEQGFGDLPHAVSTLVVVKNHHLEMDKAWARLCADSPVRYIGLLGPKARRDEILRSLTPSHHPRLFGPTGLDLGAEGPEQIALSVVAELLAVVGGRKPGHLRDRQGAIH